MTNSSTRSQCPYCGVGCGLETIASPSGYKVRGDREHPSSLGMICVKGATILDTLDQDRLLYPMFRETLDQPFRQISWDQALHLIVDRIRSLQATPEAICIYGSGQFHTEDYYVAQKLVKGCLRTNNFDANSRLCMSSAVSGYNKSLGSDGPPCCYEDLDLCNLAFLIGTNTAECHPILFNRLKKRHKPGSDLKMIVVDPRETPTTQAADLHLRIRPGTDIDLLNGIARILLERGAFDQLFIESHTHGWLDYYDLISYYSPEVVSKRCDISEQDLDQAASYWQQSKQVLSLWSMGINQSHEGTAKVCSLINLHLMTGQIGKPGSGPFSLTGQPNAMGGREAGGLAHLLPGYRLISQPDHRQQVEDFWQLPPGSISSEPGRTAWEMITGLENGSVQLLWIAATNPAVSMPDLERTKTALSQSPFTIYQDPYFPTETSEYAHLLLPACQWSEKTGVMTNSERRVTLSTAFQDPPGEAKPDWWIFAQVGKVLGFERYFPFDTAADVYAEFAALTQDRPCDHSGLSHDLLLQFGPQQWPYPEDSSKPNPVDPQRLYTDFKFHTQDGRAQFVPYHSRGLAEPPNPQFPYVLTTGRLYGHWHTQTRTGRVDKITKMHPNPFIEIHPSDAEQLGLMEQDLIEVSSARGRAYFPAKITRGIRPGTVFVPMHWGSLWADQAECNALTHPISCPDSKQPELKACAVMIKKVNPKEAGDTVRELAQDPSHVIVCF